MWSKIFQDLAVEFYWLKRDLLRRWPLDTPVGVVGIIALISGIVFMIMIWQGLAAVFRNLIPWVAGSQVGKVYWSSVAFSLKASFVFLIFCTSLIVFIIVKLTSKR